MSDHLAFIDDYANKFKAEQQKVREPIMTENTRAVVESYDDEDDDEFLTENGWSFRKGMWTDSVTKDRLPYDTAYAVQKERYRMEDIVESIQAKLEKSKKFFDGKIQEAAEIIKSQGEKIEECEEYIERLDETVNRLKEKPKAKRVSAPAPERIVERVEAPKKKVAPKTPPKPLTTSERAAEILGDYDDNILYDQSFQETAIAQANSKFVEPEPMVDTSEPAIEMSEEDREAYRMEQEAMQSMGSSGGISESALTSDMGGGYGGGGSPAKYTMSPPNKEMQAEAGSYLL